MCHTPLQTVILECHVTLGNCNTFLCPFHIQHYASTIGRQRIDIPRDSTFSGCMSHDPPIVLVQTHCSQGALYHWYQVLKWWRRHPWWWVSLWNRVNFMWPSESMRPGSLIYIVSLYLTLCRYWRSVECERNTETHITLVTMTTCKTSAMVVITACTYFFPYYQVFFSKSLTPHSIHSCLNWDWSNNRMVRNMTVLLPASVCCWNTEGLLFLVHSHLAGVWCKWSGIRAIRQGRWRGRGQVKHKLTSAAASHSTWLMRVT